jgi:hypothetical protein
LSIYNKSKKSSNLGDAVNGFDHVIQTRIFVQKARVTRGKFCSTRVRVFELRFETSERRKASWIRCVSVTVSGRRFDTAKTKRYVHE